jgi:hypothetical protein
VPLASRRPGRSVDELEACFVVKDGAGQKLAYIYYEEEPVWEIVRQTAHKGRSAADRGEYRQAQNEAARSSQAGGVGPSRQDRCGLSGPRGQVFKPSLTVS